MLWHVSQTLSNHYKLVFGEDFFFFSFWKFNQTKTKTKKKRTYCASKNDFIFVDAGIFAAPADNPRAGDESETSPSCDRFCRYAMVNFRKMKKKEKTEPANTAHISSATGRSFLKLDLQGTISTRWRKFVSTMKQKPELLKPTSQKVMEFLPLDLVDGLVTQSLIHTPIYQMIFCTTWSWG